MKTIEQTIAILKHRAAIEYLGQLEAGNRAKKENKK